MGCLVRGIVGVICFFSLVFSAMGYLGMQIVNSEKEEAGRMAESAVEKRLDEALRQDGPAWVKGRLELASGATAIRCGDQNCLWKRTERFETLQEDIRKAGTWTRQYAMRKVQDEKSGAPFALLDGAAKLSFADWLGVMPADDLLQIRQDQAPLMGELPEQLPASAAMAWQVKERFLLPGQDVWMLADFKNGAPKGYANGYVYLTGLGPQRFAHELSANSEIASTMRWIFLMGTVLPILYFGALILKRTS